MTKIKLLLLENCSRCEQIKKQLGKNYIYYDYEICNSDTEICDSIEELIGCSNYPIVLKIRDNRHIEEIIYITNDYNQIGKNINLNNKIKGKAFYSIDKLIEYVINL